jgi:hypothetical protein
MGSEIDKIRWQYENGQLDEIKEDLGRFLCAHRERILGFRSEQVEKGVELSVEAAIKFYLVRYRSINPQKEIKEQLEEIQKEKWIRGIQMGCAPDAEAVAHEWAKRFSAVWREHRVTTIIYVFERDKDRFCGLLGG